MPEDRTAPEYGDLWINTSTGLAWRCVSSDPVTFVDSIGRQRRPSAITLARVWKLWVRA